MRQLYVILRTDYYVGIRLLKGDIVEILSEDSWKVLSGIHASSEESFIGNIFQGHQEDLVPIDLSTSPPVKKTKIELKIERMWTRQPYYKKIMGIAPTTPKYIDEGVMAAYYESIAERELDDEPEDEGYIAYRW